MTLRATFGDESTTRTEFGLSTTSGSFSQIKWEAGDQINVFSSAGASAVFSTEDNDVTAVFTSVSGEELPGNSFLGLSPYDSTATGDLVSKSIKTTIPAVQQAFIDSFDPAALLAVGFTSRIEDQMSFYNVWSGLRFTLVGSNVSNYKSIELSGNDGEMVAGRVSISCSPLSNPEASPISGSSSTVSLVLPKGKSFEKNKTYYLIFRPGEFPKGFTLTFKDDSGAALVKSVCSSYVEFKRSTFAYVRGVDNPDNLAKIRDGEPLSENGTANCYIVSKAGSYKFLLARATEKDALTGISSVKVLWETDNTGGSQKVGSIVSSVVTNGKYVYFKTPDTIKNGNALIAAYRGSEIVWSWHIWVCNGYDPSSTKQLYSGKNAAMMDRNLGALSSSPMSPLTNGLFYQWGRKDPFPGAVESYVASPSGGTFMSLTGKWDKVSSDNDSSIGSTDYATAHPTSFITTTRNTGNWNSSSNNNTLWTQTKTVNDPCPAGWRVPAAYVLNSQQHVLAQEAWSNLDYRRVASGSYGVYLDGSLAWYPNNGYITTAGALLMVGQFSCYWSCSPQAHATYAMEMSQTAVGLTFNPCSYGKIRGEGHSVRCVEDK